MRNIDAIHARHVASNAVPRAAEMFLLASGGLCLAGHAFRSVVTCFLSFVRSVVRIMAIDAAKSFSSPSLANTLRERFELTRGAQFASRPGQHKIVHIVLQIIPRPEIIQPPPRLRYRRIPL